jgi:abortive infection bacteriophage resistance protein
MKYSKPPITGEDQIKLLDSRGMAFSDHTRAVRYFSNINYYRLRAYWVPFEDTSTTAEDHHFKSGTTFDAVLTLYIFDRKLRLLIWEAIERIEVSIRTHFVDVLALKYGSHAHMHSDIFYNPELYQEILGKLTEEITRSKETFIEHYNSTYDNPSLPPIWASCEVMSFGQISKWISNLKYRQDRKDIASTYGLDEKILVSFMHHLTHIRNLSAHHCRLWNRKLTVTMTIPRFPTALALFFNNSDDRHIYNTLAMLGYLMRVISPKTTWPNRLQKLIGEYPQIDTMAMGFPADWQNLPLWRRQTDN